MGICVLSNPHVPVILSDDLLLETDFIFNYNKLAKFADKLFRVTLAIFFFLLLSNPKVLDLSQT